MVRLSASNFLNKDTIASKILLGDKNIFLDSLNTLQGA